MKVRSKKQLPYTSGRSGIKYAIIEIELLIIRRDTVKKTITMQATDYRIEPDNPMGITRHILYMDEFNTRSKEYEIPYAEYEYQKAALLTMKTYTETGLELEDKLLQDGLLYSLQTDPIWESEGTDWVAYTDPVIEIEVPVVPPPVMPLV
jgi:hypothetical protein